jgi:RimJ/RimL family protein N-acetyltransferase
MELTDGVIVIRRFRDDDVAGIVAMCNDPETRRFIPHVPEPYDEDDARAYLDFCETCWEERRRRPFAIADARTGEYLGSIDIRLGSEGSVGYGVAPWARRRGVASRALDLVASWALGDGGVRRLELTTHSDNVPSQRVAERAGFVQVDVVHHDPPLRGDRRATLVYERRPG